MPSEPIDACLYKLDPDPDHMGYLTFPSPRRRGNVVVVGDVLLLRHSYDPAQRWFPFMQGAILAHQEPEAESVRDFRLKLAGEHEWDTVDSRNEYPALYQRYPTSKRDVPQLCLPFFENREIEDVDVAHMSAARFPTFERDADGNIYTIYYRRSEMQKLRNYLYETCVGSYFIDEFESNVIIELEEDAVATKLMFK